MSQTMWAVVRQLDSEAAQPTCHYRPKRAAVQRTIRCPAGQKKLTSLGGRTDFTQITNHGIPHRTDQWILLRLALFRTPDSKQLPLPVKIFQAQAYNLTRPQAIDGQQQNNGPVT